MIKEKKTLNGVPIHSILSILLNQLIWRLF